MTTNLINETYNPNDGKTAKLPSFLNVLTILTMVWNAILFVLAFVNYFGADKAYAKYQQASEKLADAPAFAKTFLPSAEVMQKTLDNKLPILILTALSCILSIYGAVLMRQLKKQGFTIYLVAKVLVIVMMGVFMSVQSLTSISGITGLVITAAFIIMYATQAKYLVNK